MFLTLEYQSNIANFLKTLKARFIRFFKIENYNKKLKPLYKVDKMQNILITGPPKVGKTTLINNLVNKSNKSVIGFVTNEIKEKGDRTGFNIQTFSGLEFPLASKSNFSSKFRVSSYGVYVENIEAIINKLYKELQDSKFDLIIIDEIGKMELFSPLFKKFLEQSLETRKVLGTIMLRDNYFTKKIKVRLDTTVFHLNRENKQLIEEKIMELLINA